MVYSEGHIKRKFSLPGLTKDNIDDKLKEVLEQIKDDIAHHKYGNVKITVDIMSMSWKEGQLYVDIKAEVKKGS